MKRRTLLLNLSAGAISLPSISNGMGGGINASEFGLIANAPNDQSDILATAINAAIDQGMPLFIAGGTYHVAGIVLPTNCNIIGVDGATILASANGEAVFTSSWQTNITLQSLTFDGKGAGASNQELGLLKFEECASLRILDCRFQSYADNGIHLRNCSGKITGSIFNDLRQSAIHGQNSNGLLISGNSIHNCWNGGIRVWRHDNGADRTIVTDNHISKIGSDWGDGQNGNGINIFQADEVIVANNSISDCALSAIRANSTNNTIIRGNQCINSLEVGIFSEFAFSGSIISDNLVDGAATGISITNFDDGGRLAICSNNIVRNIMPFSPTNPDTVPIGIFAEADTAVTGNVVENVPGVGIGVGWGGFLRNVLVANNIIRQTKYGIAISIAEGAGHAKISDNMIVDASEGAIIGAQWDKIITRDLIGDADNYAQLQIEDNSVL